MKTGPLEGWVLRSISNGFFIGADDERDVKAIIFGMDLFDSYGMALSIDKFERELKGQRDIL